MPKKTLHVHKYKRFKFSKDGNIFYKCVLENCSHYIPVALLPGRENICWVCGTIHVIKQKSDVYKLGLKPHCDACTKVRDNNPIKSTDIDTLADMLG